jgi:hypothetical protein
LAGPFKFRIYLSERPTRTRVESIAGRIDRLFKRKKGQYPHYEQCLIVPPVVDGIHYVEMVIEATYSALLFIGITNASTAPREMTDEHKIKRPDEVWRIDHWGYNATHKKEPMHFWPYTSSRIGCLLDLNERRVAIFINDLIYSSRSMPTSYTPGEEVYFFVSQYLHDHDERYRLLPASPSHEAIVNAYCKGECESEPSIEPPGWRLLLRHGPEVMPASRPCMEQLRLLADSIAVPQHRIDSLWVHIHRLLNALYVTNDIDHDHFELSGSFARKTAIYGWHDIDVLCPLRKLGSNPQQTIDSLQQFIEHAFDKVGVTARAQGHSVGVFPVHSPEFDLVVGARISHGATSSWIITSEPQRCYLRIFPSEVKLALDAVDMAHNGQVRHVILLLKLWLKQSVPEQSLDKTPLKSFHLELEIADIFRQAQHENPMPSLLPECILYVLRELHNRLMMDPLPVCEAPRPAKEPPISSPLHIEKPRPANWYLKSDSQRLRVAVAAVESALDVVVRANAVEKDGDVRQAHIHWEALFGPLYRCVKPEKSDVIAATASRSSTASSSTACATRIVG